ncbi:MAG: hypothetical protein ACU0CI_11785 [Shimia sp.]
MSSRWDAHIDDDETILWEGRPDQGFHLGTEEIIELAIGIVFLGGVLFFATGVRSSNDGIFDIVLAGAVLIGVGLIGLAFVGNLIERRGAWYALTDRAAMIETNSIFRGRKIRGFMVTPDMPVSLQPTTPPTIYFAEEIVYSQDGSHIVKIGFERIAEAEKVLELLEQQMAAGPRDADGRLTSDISDERRTP